MKKNLFFAMTALAALASCSSDEGGNPTPLPTTATPAIQLLVRQDASISVNARGTGAVGDITTTENVWKGQEVNIYMLEKGKTVLAYFDDVQKKDNNPIYNGTTFITPNGVTKDYATDKSGDVKYYPSLNGAFDFWGFRLDDAKSQALKAGEEPVKASEAATSTKNKISYNFVIDGSQDIMAGKAELTPDQELILATAENKARAYSAFTARQTVQPNIKFKHMLTRFTFDIKSVTDANGQTAANVVIDSVKIVSRSKGNLVVAYADGVISDYKKQISWLGEKTDSLTLMERKTGDDASKKLVKLGTNGEIKPDADPAKSVKVGESFLVPGEEATYDIVFFVHETVKVGVYKDTDPEVIAGTKTAGEDKFQDIRRWLNQTLAPPTGQSKFAIGSSYNVVLKIHSISKIEITVELEPWAEGGEIAIDPEV